LEPNIARFAGLGQVAIGSRFFLHQFCDDGLKIC